MTSQSTVVFGIDGAHFELIEPWLAEGALPNVQSVLEEGCSADLRSVLPPVTSPNWKAYSTGKNPGKIGIYWWENVDTENHRIYYPAARKHANLEFWEYLARDWSVGVINVPTTYPPKQTGEFLLAGAPDGENAGFSHPERLEERLRKEFDYRVIKENRLDGNREEAVEEILELIDIRFNVARTLYSEHDLDFLQVTTFYINSLQHYLWDHHDTRQGWERIDEHLGWFLKQDCNIVLMSDHGSSPIRTVFNLNTWLEREGYLKIDTGVADALYEVGITKDRLVRLSNRLGVKPLAKRLAPRWLLTYIPDDTGAVNKEGKTATVDWEATDAIASGQGPIYLTAQPSESGYDLIREEIKEDLESLTDREGNPITKSVRYGEEVYSGPYVDEAPDLVVEQAPGVHIPGGIGHSEIFAAPADEGWLAENKQEGLFAALGPDFASGSLDSLSILDLAPTLLHLYNEPVPEDMDGSVRLDAFAHESGPSRREPEIKPVDERRREIDRIRRVARQSDL